MKKNSLLRASMWIAMGIMPFLAPGCSSVLGTSGPSAVAQGIYYSSGNPHFDEFFVVFHDSQVAMGTAADRAKAATSSMVEALGLPPDTTHETLLEKTKLAADEFESGGIHLRLTIPDLDTPNPPSPSAKLDTMGGTPDDAKRKIADAIQNSANECLKLVAELKNRKTTLTQLRVQAITLDTEVDEAFRKEGPGQKHDVHKNLQDAQKLVPLMDARADEVLRDEVGFLKNLKPAVDRNVAAFDAPTAPPEQPQAPDDEKPKKKKSKSSAKATTPAPATAAPAGPGFEP